MKAAGDLLGDQRGVAAGPLTSDLLKKKGISADLFFEVWAGACYQENREILAFDTFLKSSRQISRITEGIDLSKQRNSGRL